MNNLIRNYLYNVCYQIFMMIVPIFTAPYLARVLGSTQLGIYSYINAISSIIITIGLIGLSNYGVREIAYVRSDKKKMTQVFFELFWLRILICLLITILYFVFTFQNEYKNYFIIQYFLILATFLDISWFFIAIEEMKVVVLRNFCAKIVTVIIIFIFVKKPEDLWIYIFTFSFITLITTLTLFRNVKQYLDKSPKIKMKNLFKHILPSLKILLPQIATLVYLQVDKIMIKNFTQSTESLAFYEQGEKIIMIPLALITALSSVLMPHIAHEFQNKKMDNLVFLINKIINFALFASLPMTVGIILISNDFIPWYLGSQFIPVISVIVILSPIIISNSLINISGNQIFTATNQISIMTRSYSLSAMINIIINILLIPRYLHNGAAISTVVSSIVAVIYQYYYLNKQINIKEGFNSLFKYILACIVMIIFVIIAKRIEINSFYSTFIQIIIGIITYCSCLFYLKDETIFLIINKLLNQKMIRYFLKNN